MCITRSTLLSRSLNVLHQPFSVIEILTFCYVSYQNFGRVVECNGVDSLPESSLKAIAANSCDGSKMSFAILLRDKFRLRFFSKYIFLSNSGRTIYRFYLFLVIKY